MNAVGIDVSKGKSVIAILRSYGEIVSSPFELHHTSKLSYFLFGVAFLCSTVPLLSKF